MSGLDKILEHITKEATNEAEQIISGAEKEAESIISSGKEETERQVAQMNKQSELDAASAAKRIQSAAELKEKRLILQAKQKSIEKVFDDAKDYLEGLNDKEYFSVIAQMLQKYAGSEKGTIAFSDKDLKRLPEEICAEAKKRGLKIQEEPANISGGFILSYGDICENCSFDSLISASKEELQDKIGKLLFS